MVYTKLAELRKLLHGGLDPVRTRELTDRALRLTQCASSNAIRLN